MLPPNGGRGARLVCFAAASVAAEPSRADHHLRLLFSVALPQQAVPAPVCLLSQLIEPKAGALSKFPGGSASYNPRTGFVEWSLTLQAGEKAVLPLRYEIDATLNARLTKVMG